MKARTKLTGLFDFVEFTHEFRNVFRVARASNADHFENDVEHSYQLAMVAWYLIETEKLNLNKELCFMYALAHDLVEIYAGDTYIFDTNKDAHLSKKQREKEGLEKIGKRFPHFKSLREIIERYEEKKDDESKFIYALDKLIPPVQIYMEKGKLWREKGINLEQIIENKAPKVALSKPVDNYWQELVKRLADERKELFS